MGMNDAIKTKVTAPKLTEAQRRALDWALAHGAVFAGRNHARRGTTTEHDVLTVPANTIRALGKRGLLRVGIGPDGGVMGRPS